MARGGARTSAGLAAAALVLLGGCSAQTTPADVGQAPCPRIAILADGADLTRFRPGAGRDLTGMVLDARIAGFQARCDFTGRDRRVLEVRVTPLFAVERGPAAGGNAVDLPWFLVLSDADDREDYLRAPVVTRVTFPANQQSVLQPGQPTRVNVPIGEGRASDFLLRLSFQLTPDELAHNRSRGPR
jgi:hypothetical protein